MYQRHEPGAGVPSAQPARLLPLVRIGGRVANGVIRTVHNKMGVLTEGETRSG
jgi:hypothetical protein